MPASCFHQLPATDDQVKRPIDALLREAARHRPLRAKRLRDWRFFRVTPDEELRSCAFVRREAYPDAFETLEMPAARPPWGHRMQVADTILGDVRLYDRRAAPALHHLLPDLVVPGSWVIQCWFYYPFDLGGLGAHLHDPEHLFVEIGCSEPVRRVIGAGHGYIAGNNIYSSDRAGALPIGLPLFAMIEFGKHATATDIDRDGIFHAGTRRERAGNARRSGVSETSSARSTISSSRPTAR